MKRRNNERRNRGGISVGRVLFAALPWAILTINMWMLVEIKTELSDINYRLNRLSTGQVSVDSGLGSRMQDDSGTGDADSKDAVNRDVVSKDAASAAAQGMDGADRNTGIVSKGNAGITDRENTGKSEKSYKMNEDADYTIDYVSLCGLDKVDKPKERSEREVLARLEDLAKSNEMIKKIVGNIKDYPDKMLEALANNPEMADFVVNYPNWDGTVNGVLTDGEKKQEYPLFLQWDPRWGYAQYGENNIGLSGCGPTCLSMILYYMTGDASLTPDVIGEYSMEIGYYMFGTGTTWALMQEVPALYGITAVQSKVNEENMKAVLDRGGYIICSMGPGDFTAAGHFIVIYGYDENGFKVNDPNCVARSRQSWPFEQIRKQIKNTWCYEKSKGVVAYSGAV